MRIFLWAAVIAVVVSLAVPAFAQGQGGRRWPGGRSGGVPGTGGGAGGDRGPDRDGRNGRDGRDGRDGPDSRGGIGNDVPDVGWGESGTEQRIEPGDTVKAADKEKRLEEEADKLGLEDKKQRKALIDRARTAWTKCEREDKRYYGAWKRVKNNEEALAKEKEKHKAELAEAWKECDDKLAEGEVLSSDALLKFQVNTNDLRVETATDKSHKQDEIRARKLEEQRKRAEEWRKRNAPGAKEDENKEKKEKKEDEEE
jgi:hypothetical protein